MSEHCAADRPDPDPPGRRPSRRNRRPRADHRPRPVVRRRTARRRGGLRLGLCAFLSVLGLTLAWVLPADALDVTGGSGPVTGNATWFSGLGSPYGGCGLPQDQLDTQDFLALNVFDTPGDYGSYPRPIPASDASIMGMFDNGLNCGRYVRVTVGDYCTGVNDGAQNEPFCRNGAWESDKYNGATLTFVVADSCADPNAWCRDDPYHVDLAQASLNRFQLNGGPVGDMYPDHWNNRHVSWQFVPAPDYTGDLRIGFLQSAQAYWPAIAVSHLPNGIHGVRYYQSGTWQDATMDGDMGEDYVIGPTAPGGSQYEIQVVDASGALVQGGRVYHFSLPASCGSSCGQAYTPVSYTTTDPGTGTGSPSPTAPGSGSPSASVSASSAPSGSPSASASGGGGAAACTVTDSVVNSWSGGYQLQFTVGNPSGTSALTGWQVGFSFAGGQTVASSWNAAVTQSGPRVAAVAEGYNGSVPPGGSTTWGMVVDGAQQPLADLGCT